MIPQNEERYLEQGYMVLGVLFLMLVGMVISAGMLDLTATNTKTRALVKTQAEYYYDAEETTNKVVAWLQANSKNIVTAFEAADFNSNFDLGDPTTGDNEGLHFEVPTMLKMKGTNNSVMLSNNSFFGASSFPTTTNIDTEASFNAAAEFQNADLGNANARAVIIWARETDGHYEPIFRVDAVTGNNPDRGVHSFTYVYSQLVADTSGTGASGQGIGFYTEAGPLTTKNGNNTCDSYLWTWNGVAWNKGAPRSNCIVASKQTIFLESRISGNALSLLNDGVTIDKPNGEVSGTVCDGPGCHSHSLSPFPTWATTCAGNSQGNLTINGVVNLASGPALNNQCWETITVSNDSTLNLTDTTNPYRFKSLAFQNNSNSKLAIPTLAPGNKVTVYADGFSGGQLNGNQLFNTNNAPQALQVNITGSANFKINGNADMNAHFIAPLSVIEHLGNFNFHGAIECKQFNVTGNGTFNYDEGINAPVAFSPVVTDINFALKKASQRYR